MHSPKTLAIILAIMIFCTIGLKHLTAKHNPGKKVAVVATSQSTKHVV